MKVMWLSNRIPGAVQKHLNQSAGDGQWVDHVLTGLQTQPEISLRILCRGDGARSGQISKTLGYCIFAEPKPQTYDPALETLFRQELQSFQPDVIHIWGTEFGHTLAMVNAAQALGLEKRVAVSIQGLCTYVFRHYNEGIPQRVIHSSSLRDFLRHDNLAQQAKTYARRGDLEVEALRKVRHVIGRTEWDRACTGQINPEAVYHTCNETMRAPFYSGTWHYAQCSKHQIFVTNWAAPYKGFHYLLEALHLLLPQYPDAEVFVAGSSYYSHGLKDRLRARAHQKYLVRLTDQYGLKEKIHFTGFLTAEQMKEAFLRSNVYVLPSMIENSPNTVCEAMLLGVPCISAAVGGMMKMMKHGEEGFLYQSTAPYMLAYYIGRVFRMGAEAEKMGLAAQAHAGKTHDPETNLRTLLEIYGEVAKEQKTWNIH